MPSVKNAPRHSRDRSLALYTAGERHAESCGIIVADTKFEFGIGPDQSLVLIDEVLTPDSSRFWPKDRYLPGRTQPSFDKQPLRDYLDGLRRAGRWNGEAPPPPLPAKSSRRPARAISRHTVGSPEPGCRERRDPDGAGRPALRPGRMGNLRRPGLLGWWWVAALWFPIAVWTIVFFRDPRGTGPRGEDLIISPADGLVVSVIPVDEPAFLHEGATRISIFMNVVNVHVNRYPVSGRLRYRHYSKGAFGHAMAEKGIDQQ